MRKKKKNMWLNWWVFGRRWKKMWRIGSDRKLGEKHKFQQLSSPPQSCLHRISLTHSQKVLTAPQVQHGAEKSAAFSHACHWLSRIPCESSWKKLCTFRGCFQNAMQHTYPSSSTKNSFHCYQCQRFWAESFPWKLTCIEWWISCWISRNWRVAASLTSTPIWADLDCYQK